MTRRRAISIGYLLLFAAALAGRALHLAFIHHEAFFQLRFGDALRYHHWARAIANGDWVGSGVFYQAPLYPYFLAVVYKLFGDSVLTVALVQSVLGSLACVLLAAAGHRWFRNPRVGFIAGAMLAVYPPAVFFDGLIQKSALDGLLMCAMLAALASARRFRGWIAVGVVIGLLALVRERALVFAALLGVWCFKTTPGSGTTRLAHVACLLLGIAIILLPVAARNKSVGGEFHLTTSQLGPNLYIGNHAQSDGIYRALRFGRGDPAHERNDAALLAEQATGRELTPGEVSRYWVGRTVDDIRADPLRWLRLIGRKALLLVNRIEIADTEDQYTYAAASPVLRPGLLLSFGLLCALAAGGFVIAWRRRTVRLLALLCAGYGLTVIAFYVMARYRYPLAPMLMLPAAMSWVYGWRLKRNWWVSLAGVAVVAVAFIPLVDVNPMRATTLYNTATQLKGEEALTYYDKALRFDENYPVAWLGRGNACVVLNRYDEAAESYRRALQLQNDFASALNGLARVAVLTGKPSEAEAHWREALRLDANDAAAHNGIGVLLTQRFEFEKAIHHFRRVAELHPHFAMSHLNIAMCLQQLGDTPGAIEAAKRALAIDPDDRAAAHLLNEWQAVNNRSFSANGGK